MNSEPRPSSRWARWTDTPHLISYVGIIAILSILALTFALSAQAKAAQLAKQQAEQSRIQAQLVRDAICSTFRDVAASPVTPKTTQLGRNLVRDTAHGADVAHCPVKP